MTPSALTAIRVSMGWSQARLAQEIGVHRSTVLKWESGQHPIPAMAENLMRRIGKNTSTTAAFGLSDADAAAIVETYPWLLT